jgi:hypothetical protein
VSLLGHRQTNAAWFSGRVTPPGFGNLAQELKLLAHTNKTICGLPVKRATAMTNNDYYVFTFRRGERPERWSWEIRRKSSPLGVKLIEHGFQSETAAQFAGKQALADFLSELSKEERRIRK